MYVTYVCMSLDYFIHHLVKKSNILTISFFLEQIFFSINLENKLILLIKSHF